jgi:O-antigen/teichoic acid export membrane protein
MTSQVSWRSLVASAWWMTGSNLVAQTFGYGSLIYLAHVVRPADFGTVALGTAAVCIGSLIVSRGTYGAVMVDRTMGRADLVRAHWRCVVVGGILGALMAVSANWLVAIFAKGGDPRAVAALAVCLPLYGMGIVPTALLHRSMRFRRLAGAATIASVLSAAVGVLAGVGGLGVWSLVARFVLLSAAQVVLASALCLPELRGVLSAPTGTARPGRAHSGDRWFFLFGVTLVLTTNLDNLVIGASSDARLLGLYAVAFTIAMAPVTHLSEQVGKVLFAAAAADPESSSERTVHSVRLMTMLLLPLLPVGVLVAPVVLPAVLGPEWTEAVPAFQVLWVAGVVHAVVNCIGEPLSGIGQIAFRARTMVVRCVATLVTLWLLVRLDGIRGAGIAHLAVCLPYAAVYFTVGARRAGTTERDLWRVLRPVARTVAVQLVATCFAVLVLTTAGAPAAVVASAVTIIGLGAAAYTWLPALGRTTGWS